MSAGQSLETPYTDSNNRPIFLKVPVDWPGISPTGHQVQSELFLELPHYGTKNSETEFASEELELEAKDTTPALAPYNFSN